MKFYGGVQSGKGNVVRFWERSRSLCLLPNRKSDHYSTNFEWILIFFKSGLLWIMSRYGQRDLPSVGALVFMYLFTDCFVRCTYRTWFEHSLKVQGIPYATVIKLMQMQMNAQQAAFVHTFKICFCFAFTYNSASHSSDREYAEYTAVSIFWLWGVLLTKTCNR